MRRKLILLLLAATLGGASLGAVPSDPGWGADKCERVPRVLCRW